MEREYVVRARETKGFAVVPPIAMFLAIATVLETVLSSKIAAAGRR